MHSINQSIHILHHNGKAANLKEQTTGTCSSSSAGVLTST
jgi:hypothetical protein